MAELIAQYQVGSFTSPTDGDSPISATVVKSNDNVMRAGHNSHDGDPGVHLQSSSLAARPAAGTAGRKWFTTDGKRIYYDNGTTWDEAAYLPLVGGTVTGATTFSGATTHTGLLTVNKIRGQGSAPSAAGSANVSGTPIVTGTDLAGQISFTTVGSPGTGNYTTITLNTAMTGNFVVFLTAVADASNVAIATKQLTVSTAVGPPSTFGISFLTALLGGQGYTFQYLLVQVA